MTFDEFAEAARQREVRLRAAGHPGPTGPAGEPPGRRPPGRRDTPTPV